MQELGIVFHVIKHLEDMNKAKDIRQVSKVTLQIGEMSGLLPDYLLDCWSWVSKRYDFLKGSELCIDEVEAVTACNHCKKEFSPLEHGTRCPKCSSSDTVMITGNEMCIKEIEAC